MFKSNQLLIAAIAATALGASAAQANTITTLFNTGVDSAGTPQANNALDTHYALVSGPVTPALRSATTANGYPVDVWGGDDGVSNWIGPVGDGHLDGPVGYYDYQVSFSLAGLNAATALITGRWATDDHGYDVKINGISTGQNAGFATNWTAFSITSGFVAGTNTLDFIVYNSGGPTGLRVEMAGTARGLAGGVPEPASWALMMLGFGGLGAVLRRRRADGLRAA
ncbi:PEPxxWA-CTERM sorting domain-containing protein [Phenylobacterium sp.]|uniref:PEPxxWA-CTERM sorting domain-containing protein n=1 Tax=Phenylobacterium sp. TaxID=1871053 RepID=UPI00374DE7A5